MNHFTSTKEEEVVKLAVQEGHDADIPTNEKILLAGMATMTHKIP